MEQIEEKMNFNELDLPIPTELLTYEYKIQKLVFDYLDNLDEKEKIAYKIAYEHLGSSFHILRSNGYQEWINKENNKKKKNK
jgi:hypothetical protein